MKTCKAFVAFLTADYGDPNGIDCCTNEELARWMNNYVANEDFPEPVLIYMAATKGFQVLGFRVLGFRIYPQVKYPLIREHTLNHTRDS